MFIRNYSVIKFTKKTTPTTSVEISRSYQQFMRFKVNSITNVQRY